MALINCPECKKEVSDRAYSCPVCGFPISDYLEEQKELEDEKKRENIIRERAQKYKNEFNFVFNSEHFKFNENHRICALICAEYQRLVDGFHTYYENTLFHFNRNHPSEFTPNQFKSVAHNFVDFLYKPFITLTLKMCDMFLDKECDEREWYEEDVFNAVEKKDVITDLINIHAKASAEYSLNSANAHMKYYDDYYDAGTIKQPIESIYSKTLLGLIGKGISAKMINGAVQKLSEGKIKNKEHLAAQKYYSTEFKEYLLCNARIYSVLFDYVEEVAKCYKDFLFDYLIDAGSLFEVHNFPTHIFDSDKYVSCLQSETTTNATKLQSFIDTFKTNPGEDFIYSLALEYISLDEDNFNNLLKIIKFFKFEDNVKEILSERLISADNLFDNTTNINELKNEISVKSRTYKSNVYSSVEEKELFIEEEKQNENVIAFLESKDWFIKENFISLYEKLHKLKEPYFEKWKINYQKAIIISEQLHDIICDNIFLDSINEAITEIYDTANGIHLYNIDSLQEKQCFENNLYEGKVCSNPDEFPIIKIKGNVSTLLITTKSFYLFDSNKNTFLAMFSLEHINELSFAENTIFCSKYFALDIKEYGKIVIIRDKATYEDYKCLDYFTSGLHSSICRRRYKTDSSLLKMECPSCKNTIKKTSKFCNFCGYKF